MNEKNEHLTRRRFLETAGGKIASLALASAGIGSIIQKPAFGARTDDFDRYDFLMARLRYASGSRVRDPWNVGPDGDNNLLKKLGSTVRCKVKLLDKYPPRLGSERHFNAVVDIDDMKVMRRYPFLFMTGSSPYKLSSREKKNLEQYIKAGGFLLIDDCVIAASGDFFYKSSYKILEEVFGPGSVKRIPNDHEIFHNVFDLSRIGLPYMQGQDHGARGVFIGDRLAVFLSSSDIHCGWRDGHYPGRGYGGKKRKSKRIQGHKEAIEMGINIIMYAISH